MSLFPSLFLPMVWALDGLASPQPYRRLSDNVGLSPTNRECGTTGTSGQMRRGRNQATNTPTCSCECRDAPYASPLSLQHDSNLHRNNARPRSLLARDSSSSSVSHPILVGVVIGVVGTLFVLGFGYILVRVYRRHRELRFRNQIRSWTRPVPSAPLQFRHIEHFSTSATTLHPETPSSSRSKAALLRVAHRRPDGSWAFTDAPSPTDASTISPWSPSSEAHKPWNIPDTTKPWNTPHVAKPWHAPRTRKRDGDPLRVDTTTNMPHPLSPTATTTPSSSSATAFSYDTEPLPHDGSSSKTGPPPYASGAGLGFGHAYPPTLTPQSQSHLSPMLKQEAARAMKVARSSSKDGSPKR